VDLGALVDASHESYEYGGPPSCALPPEMMVAGCPTLVHEFTLGGRASYDTTLVYDSAGRLVRAETRTADALASLEETVTPEYDAAGQLISLTDQRGDRARTSTYERQRSSWVRRTEGGASTYTLDEAGRVIAHAGPHESGTWTYDGDRLTTIDVRETPGDELHYHFDYECADAL
jgi:hypothetical protein